MPFTQINPFLSCLTRDTPKSDSMGLKRLVDRGIFSVQTLVFITGKSVDRSQQKLYGQSKPMSIQLIAGLHRPFVHGIITY